MQQCHAESVAIHTVSINVMAIFIMYLLVFDNQPNTHTEVIRSTTRSLLAQSHFQTQTDVSRQVTIACSNLSVTKKKISCFSVFLVSSKVGSKDFQNIINLSTLHSSSEVEVTIKVESLPLFGGI